MDLSLSAGQYDLVYNLFSFVIAAMGASLLFFVLVRGAVAPRHRMALTLSTVVVGIALYHYVRIFNSGRSLHLRRRGIRPGRHPVQRGLPLRRLDADRPAAAR